MLGLDDLPRVVLVMGRPKAIVFVLAKRWPPVTLPNVTLRYSMHGLFI